jgi:hypothetical protein
MLLLASAVGAGLAAWWLGRRVPHPGFDRPGLIERVREVARLETLEVTLHKKVNFAPDPAPADTVWGEVMTWARHSLAKPQGRAIVFAKASLAYDLEKLTVEDLTVKGDTAHVTLPPLLVRVELLPDETEVIDSNLNSTETAKLFALAKEAFGDEVAADAALRDRARRSAEASIRALLLSAGFREVTFDSERPSFFLR